MIATVYHKLLDLVRNCNIELKPTNQNELNDIYDALIKCRINFGVGICAIVFNLVKHVFAISDLSIADEEAIRLYDAIHKFLE